jgi:hypothetical protein
LSCINPIEEDKLLKKILGLFAVLTVLFGAAACGRDWDRDNYYRPASFGENNQCYYMQTQAEAEMLIREGLCQPTWRPAQAPFSWQTRYMPYYSSAEYRDYYVPASTRKVYAIYTREFNTKWSSEIKKSQSSAVYVDNKGKTADGNTVPRGQFGGGVRSKGGQGIRGDNNKSVKKNADSYYKKQADKQKNSSSYSSGGGYKSGSSTKSGTGWKSSSSSKSTGGGIRSGRR